MKPAPKGGAQSQVAAVKKQPEKVLSRLLRKHQGQWVGGTPALKHELTTLVPWPQNMRKGRVLRRPRKFFPVFNQLSETFGNNLGFVRRCGGSVPHGKDEEGAPGNSGTLFETRRYLYEELEEEILSRLPVRSLIRFRCVCKSWRDVIDDEKFISLHQKNNKTSYLLMGTCDVISSDYSFHCFLPAYGDDAARAALQKVAVYCIPDSLKPWKFVMAGVCNGILCLFYQHMAKEILLWNPATKEIKVIPPSTLPRLAKRSPIGVVGFGFDPQRNDYKILQMVHSISSYVVELELYSLRTNSWRKIDSDAIALRDKTIARGVCTLSFTENQVICWLINTYPKEAEIMCFDMNSEMLETIQVPIPLDEQLPDIRWYNLFPFKSSIALGVGYSVDPHAYSHVYVLNDFYSSQRSWTKLFSVKHHIMPRPVAAWENLFIFQETGIDPKLLLLDNDVDHDNPVLVDLGIHWHSMLVIASFYKESLVRISKIQEKPSFPGFIKKRRSRIT